jgi:hypothetical protein
MIPFVRMRERKLITFNVSSEEDLGYEPGEIVAHT